MRLFGDVAKTIKISQCLPKGQLVCRNVYILHGRFGTSPFVKSSGNAINTCKQLTCFYSKTKDNTPIEGGHEKDSVSVALLNPAKEVGSGKSKFLVVFPLDMISDTRKGVEKLVNSLSMLKKYMQQTKGVVPFEQDNNSLEPSEQHQIADSAKNFISQIPKELENSFNDMAISSMEVDMNVDMTQIKEVLLKEAAKQTGLSLEDLKEIEIMDPIKPFMSFQSKFTKPDLDGNQTIPLNFNAIVNGKIHFDLVKLSAANFAGMRGTDDVKLESKQVDESTYVESQPLNVYGQAFNNDQQVGVGSNLGNSIPNEVPSSSNSSNYGFVPHFQEAFEAKDITSKSDDGCGKDKKAEKKKEDPCKKDPCAKKEKPKPVKIECQCEEIKPKKDSKICDKSKKDKKEDPCKKKEEKKADACKKDEKKEDPCKKKDGKKDDKKEDPCAKLSGLKKEISQKMEKSKKDKKDDPCKKEEKKADKKDACKKDSDKKDQAKKEPRRASTDVCKKKEEKKADACKKDEKKEDPCKKKEKKADASKKDKKKEDPCKKVEKKADASKKDKKKEDPCKKVEKKAEKKDDPCKKVEKKAEKKDDCKKESDKKDEKPRRACTDVCKKSGSSNEETCKKLELIRNEITAILEAQKCKADPNAKQASGKNDGCKDQKKEDPCKKKDKKKDHCAKKEDPCKKKEKKNDHCNQKKEDPCKKKDKKKDDCGDKKDKKKKEDDCDKDKKNKKVDPCNQKQGPCKKKKEDPCKSKKDKTCLDSTRPLSTMTLAASNSKMHALKLSLVRKFSSYLPARYVWSRFNLAKKSILTNASADISNNDFLTRSYAEESVSSGKCAAGQTKKPKKRTDIKARTTLKEDCFSDEGGDSCNKKEGLKKSVPGPDCRTVKHQCTKNKNKK